MLEAHVTTTLQGRIPHKIAVPIHGSYRNKEYFVSRLVLTLSSPDRRVLDLALTGREIVVRVPLTSECFSEVPVSIMGDTEVTGSNNHGETFVCFDEYLRCFYLNAEWTVSLRSPRYTHNSHMPPVIEVLVGNRIRSLLEADPSLFLVVDMGADIRRKERS